MKQSLAVIAMIFEAMGRPSPTKSLLVGQVKKASVKRRVVKKIKPRAVMKLQDLVIMVENFVQGAFDEGQGCGQEVSRHAVILVFGDEKIFGY